MLTGFRFYFDFNMSVFRIALPLVKTARSLTLLDHIPTHFDSCLFPVLSVETYTGNRTPGWENIFTSAVVVLLNRADLYICIVHPV